MKLFMSYSAFLVIFALAISIPMYLYLKNTTEKNIIFSVQQSLSSIAESFELFSNQYENMTIQLYLKNEDDSHNYLMQSLLTLTSSPNEAEMLKASSYIDANIALLAEIYKSVYRISIYNDQGVFFSNKPYDQSIADMARKDNDWLKKPVNADGAAVLAYSDRDPWLGEDRTPVFSYIRLLKLGSLHVGYLEIQMRADQLIAPDKLTDISGAALSIFNNTDTLYSDLSPQHDGASQPILKFSSIAANSNAGMASFNLDGEKQSAIFRHSDRTGYTLLYAIPDHRLFAPLRLFRNVSLLSVFVLIALSIFVFYVLSRTLTYPIKKLRAMIDTVDLDDKNVEIRNAFKIDEIELLNRSFRKMNQRLKGSLEEIVQFRTLQLQSHFEVLQAQINPHFLFNMLGVITILAEEDGNAGAANVCRKLASFLRYTIIQTDPITTIENEIHFAENYLELMKTRYSHRLQYQVVLPEEMKPISIPKLTLQPLVENAVNHGFEGISGALVVTIRGQIEANRWSIAIADNGSGFDPVRMASLRQKMETFEEHLDSFQNKERLSLGGMGMISTFARLKLYYKNRIEFKIGNHPDHGASIVISGWMPDNRNVEEIV
ncbi:cache domain-containing sensor histidine kinase [Cohnella nanjingensis]|uniref:Histidine kinase n=1 Tax=Cohnella nanjingensis TaxID=1387779 RepID=A0A7X0VEE6_9BACL|nr:histidine kinase [Cohnella nanjingensis]MBB6670646.1 histidine kinase [Cohnella nanjingensis]